MLDPQTIKDIEDFVYPRPRSIQEIAHHIQKNWRTADRYIEEIKKNFGTLSTRVFREGTRGALKIVYWSSVEKVRYSAFQDQLEKLIMTGRTKYDFSGFDIFQHVKEDNKEAWTKIGKNEVDAGRLIEFKELLIKAERQILFFSGNLSFINFKDETANIFEVLEELVKKGISMKVVCRVDVAGRKNIEKLLSLNYKYGKELIEIRHREQPLRISVIDDKLINIKEMKEPTGRVHELDNKIFTFYTIKDKEWADWISRIFWKMFSTSIDAKKRIEQMDKINY